MYIHTIAENVGLDLAALPVHVDHPPQRLVHRQPRPAPTHVPPVHKEVELPRLRDEAAGRLSLLEEGEVVEPLSLLLVSYGGAPEEPMVGRGLQGTGHGAARDDVVLGGTDGGETEALGEREGGRKGERERGREGDLHSALREAIL